MARRTAPHARPSPGAMEVFDAQADEWWQPRGAFAMLHWLAVARADLVPAASRADAVLVDLGCGAGLLAPHLAGKGYHHIGVDASPVALAQAAEHGVTAVLGDVLAVPLADGCADVVVAGEILEHVTDLRRAVAEACRLLRPGGLLVLDTLAATALCRWVAVTAVDHLPVHWLPSGVHDPDLLVDRAVLADECARCGVRLAVRGIRPSVTDLLAWAVGRVHTVRMVPMATTAVLFQGRGRKEG